MWATVSIYSTVVVWLYGIGFLLTILQEPGFKQLLSQTSFRRSVKRISEPFYLICGYGDTGSKLVKALTESAITAIVVEIDPERINILELEDNRIFVPGLCGDASIPDTLILAGLKQRNCAGVVALTNDDNVNLKVAITSTLLNPGVRVIARAETEDAGNNIASFGTSRVINPFETFAGRLAMALHSPGTFLLHEWLTSVPHEKLTDPIFPPHGKWILCGYGRFGKAVHERMVSEDLQVTIIEASPETTDAPRDVIVGRGTEADTLQKAGIREAVGIVAGTDDDANNLSILMTAGELNPDLFMVVRQNSRSNDALFAAADLDLTMRRGSIIAHKIFALLRTPLLARFLDLAREQDETWANQLISRIGGVIADSPPVSWEIDINESDTPAIQDRLAKGDNITLKNLYQDPQNRQLDLPCIPILIRRRNNQYILLPDEQLLLETSDQILFCGRRKALDMIKWLTIDPHVLNYIITGEEHPSGYLWRVFTRRNQRKIAKQEIG
jgi:Trk K+ transport system NAD-binding subunit